MHLGCEDLNYIAKVYTKLKEISREQLSNIFDNFIKYILQKIILERFTIEIENLMKNLIMMKQKLWRRNN